MFTRPTTPSEYDPGLLTRFFRSQGSRCGEMEAEEQYRPSSIISGWAAARPFPNLTPMVEQGPHELYNLPSGPTSPKALLQQLTLPPTFDAGSYQSYLPTRYAPPGSPSMFPGGGAGGGQGSGCPCLTVEDFASATAMGLKKILPELATSVGVQSARANAQQVHSAPASIQPPVRAYDFAQCGPNPTVVTDLAFVDIEVFRIPRGWNAVAKEVGFAAESAAALTDLQFRILVDNQPAPYLDNIRSGDVGTLADPVPITVKATEDQRIRVQAISLTVGVNHFVRALLKGWTFQPSLMANLDSIQGWRGQ